MAIRRVTNLRTGVSMSARLDQEVNHLDRFGEDREWLEAHLINIGMARGNSGRHPLFLRAYHYILTCLCPSCRTRVGREQPEYLWW